MTPQQIHYAFDDVRHLIALGDQLKARLEAAGRVAWAREEFTRLAQWQATEEPERERWRKLKGLGNLNRRQLGVVRELYRWRELEAEKANRPARSICRDDLLVEIARRNPTRDRDLQVIRGLRRRDTAGILEAVERGRSLPQAELPPSQGREREPGQIVLLSNLLQAVLNHLCTDMALAPGLVASANDLRQLARAHVMGTPMEGPSLLNEGWRREHIRSKLEAVLQGQLVLRVAQPGSGAPLQLLPHPDGQGSGNRSEESGASSRTPDA